MGPQAGKEIRMEKKMTSKDIIIQPDVDGTGGMIFIHPGNREDVVMRNHKNTLKVSRVLAEVLQIMRDDILALQKGK